SWREQGRRYFEYEAEVPEAFGSPVISGRYAVREDRWTPPDGSGLPPVELRIYHHPTHTGNLDNVVRGMKAALEYFSEQFGPIPYREMSIVEVPSYGDFGSAFPGLVVFSEAFFNIRS